MNSSDLEILLKKYGDVSIKINDKNINIEVLNIKEDKEDIFVCIGSILEVHFEEYKIIDKISYSNNKFLMKMKK